MSAVAGPAMDLLTASRIIREAMRDKSYLEFPLGQDVGANLRTVTTAQNAQNQGSRGGSSQYRGVTWDKARQKWMATAMLDGRHKTLGRFDSEQEAAEVAAAFRREHMPYSQESA